MTNSWGTPRHAAQLLLIRTKTPPPPLPHSHKHTHTHTHTRRHTSEPARSPTPGGPGRRACRINSACTKGSWPGRRLQTSPRPAALGIPLRVLTCAGSRTCPMWTIESSSTRQGEVHTSHCNGQAKTSLIRLSKSTNTQDCSQPRRPSGVKQCRWSDRQLRQVEHGSVRGAAS